MIPAPVRRFAPLLATPLICVALTSCESVTGSVPSAAVGTYALVRVNGEALPVRIVETPTEQVDVISGRLIVNFDGSYREMRESHVTNEGGTSTGSSFTEGTLHVRGSSLEVRERQGGEYTGSYTGGELSYTIPVGTAGITFTYRQN